MSAPDFIKKEEDRLLMEAAFAQLAAGRPFVAPPGLPLGLLASGSAC
jgi:hypothetical protein